MIIINVFSDDDPVGDNFREEFERLISNKTNLEGFVTRQSHTDAKGFQVQEKTQKLNNWLATEGENSLATAIAFDNLAIALRNDADPDYLASEKNTLKALRILRKIGENNSLDAAICLDNLAGLYSQLGNVVDSIPLRKKAVEILKNLPDQGGKHLGIALSNLSTNYINLCDYEAAYFYARKSLKIQSGRGEEVGFSSTTTSILGFIEMKRGNLLQAEKYYRQDISNTDRELQKNSAQKYSNSDAAYYVPRLFLAEVLIRQNKLSEAEVILKQVKPYLDNLPSGHQNLANGLRILGEFFEANGEYLAAAREFTNSYSAYKKCFTMNHQDIPQVQFNLAKALYFSSRFEEAKQIADEWKASTAENIKKIISCGTENQRLFYMRENASFDLPAMFFDDINLANCVLNWKGLVLDSIIHQKNQYSANQSNKKLISELKKLNSKILAFDMMSPVVPGNVSISSEVKSDLQYRKESIERKLFSGSKFYSQLKSNDITWKLLNSQIPANTAVVDFFSYNDLKCKPSISRYAAILVTENNPPCRVEIGAVDQIDNKIAELRKAIDGGVKEDHLKIKLQELHKLCLSQIIKNLPPETRSIYLCPVGELNFLPFHALLSDEDTFLIENYKLALMGTGRDIASRISVHDNWSCSIYCDPDFALSKENTSPKKNSFPSSRIDDLASVSLPRLAGSESEAQEIEKTAVENGWAVKIYRRQEATEENFKNGNKSAILHLATHGFFLGDNSKFSYGSRGMKVQPIDSENFSSADLEDKKPLFFSNPMLRSGLALTFAESSIKLWFKGLSINPENDGILTAEEVGAIDLTGTWLVTLSACETGVGEARSGEGVFGLRRAFMIAGAENLLMTLWPVNDASTADFMADFYREALASGDAPGALAEVQREWLVRLRNQKGLLAAVRDAGPFVMATTGRPNRFTQFSKKPDFGFIK